MGRWVAGACTAEESVGAGAVMGRAVAKCREVVATHGPCPNNDAGDPMCLPFHGKGGCYSNCRNKADHKPHVLGERERLAGWVGEKLHS